MIKTIMIAPAPKTFSLAAAKYRSFFFFTESEGADYSSVNVALSRPSFFDVSCAARRGYPYPSTSPKGGWHLTHSNACRRHAWTEVHVYNYTSVS